MDDDTLKAKRLADVINATSDKTEAYHWLRISESGSPYLRKNMFPELDAGASRIAAMSDDQIVETYNALRAHKGKHNSPFGESDVEALRLIIKEQLYKLDDYFCEFYWKEDLPNPRNPRYQPVEISFQAEPFELDKDFESLHNLALVLSLSGILQVVGFKVSGTNIPNYDAGPEQEFFWPERGLLPLKWTPEDAIVYAAEQSADNNSQ